MSSDRWAVLGLAPARVPWFGHVTGWAMSGVVPLDFEKCLSPSDMTSRLRSERPHSAILVDGSMLGVDRDLLGAAAARDASVLVVDTPTSARDWASLGAASVLQPDFTPDELLQALRAHAQPISDRRTLAIAPPEPASRGTGILVAVVGKPGGGVSTGAAALAQTLAGTSVLGQRVVLADLSRRGDQAVLHDAPDVVPGLQELVDAHRLDRPSHEQIRSMTFEVPSRGYDLLLGLRRPRDWAVLRQPSLEAALDGLRHAFYVAILDVDDDLEGDQETGSADVGDRHRMARMAVTHADVVVAVGTPSLVGIRALVSRMLQA